jgi:hypothetical protein
MLERMSRFVLETLPYLIVATSAVLVVHAYAGL